MVLGGREGKDWDGRDGDNIQLIDLTPRSKYSTLVLHSKYKNILKSSYIPFSKDYIKPFTIYSQRILSRSIY